MSVEDHTVNSATAALARAVRDARARANLSRREVATRMGYRNISKGCSRLATWERGDDVPRGDRPDRLFDALPESAEVLRAAIQAERTAREAAELAHSALAAADQRAEHRDAELLHQHLDAVARALSGPDGAWLREARLSFARFQLAYLGGRQLRLGTLMDLWAKGHLWSPCPCHGDSMRVFQLSGSPLSGTHSLRGICPVSGEVVTGRRARQPGQTLLSFVGPVWGRTMESSASGPCLETVLASAGCTLPGLHVDRIDGSRYGTWQAAERTFSDAEGQPLAVLPRESRDSAWQTERGPVRQGGAPVIDSLTPLQFGVWRGERLVVEPEPHRPWRALAGHLVDHAGVPQLTWSRLPPPGVVSWLVGRLVVEST